MLQSWLVILASLLYLGLLFGIAYYGDLRARSQRPDGRPIVYSLTLAIFCTSWGFFGAVGQAASFGWATSPPLGTLLMVVPTYVGPIVLYLFAWRFWDKLARLGKRHKITSVADFISARYGKSQQLAALVAVIAVVGIIPYIALQLKSVAVTYQIIVGDPGLSGGPHWQDTALYVALLMAVFAILFGTRHIDATEHHEGMMLAVAFESVVKLVAFLVVGAFVTFGMFDGFGDLAERLRDHPQNGLLEDRTPYMLAFYTQVFLGFLVMFCLPRQFHVAVVENTHPNDVRTARWLYPLYLVAIGLFVWPVAAAGLVYFAPGAVDTDTFMLTLPMAAERPGLALLAFIGGLSAGTSMVIVATLAMSIMVCNDVVMPLLLRSRRLGLNQRKDLSRLVLMIRRGAILILLLLAYGYYLLTAEFVALSSFGTLAFAAVSQFAPAIIGGMYWKRASRQGAMAGMLLGFAIWIYTLLLPMLARTGLVGQGLLSEGPFGLDWLRPTALFGLDGLDWLTHGALWSLSVNLAAFLLVSLKGQRRLLERVQAAAFVDMPSEARGPDLPGRGSISVDDLQVIAERFLGAARAREVFGAYAQLRGRRLVATERAEPELIERIEHLMAGVIGASSARVVLDSALRGRDVQLDEVVTIVGEASQVLQFNRELLQATFESISQGISVVDQELRLVAWNRRYLEFYDYPEGFIRVGRRVAELIRYNAERGEYGPVHGERALNALVDGQLALFLQGRAYTFERTRPDGTVIEVRGNPMPGGGYVTTYADITEHKRVEQALRESEQSIRIYTDNVPAIIAYIDRDQRIRFVNRAYERAWGVRREQIYGRTIGEVFSDRHVQHRMPYLAAALAGRQQSFQVDLPTADGGLRHAFATYIPDFAANGEVLGLFALFHDITERVEAERALKEAKEHLEQRVEERTRALTAANAALARAKQTAEQANLSKTRFLAAASHDLLQPLNAAGLFSSALAQRLRDPELKNLTGHIEGALRSAEGLLSELLDISKLDAGAMKPQLTDFFLGDLLHELAVEFSALAEKKGLTLDTVDCRRVVRTDRQLLRRVLQNFLSNAIRYTRTGRILFGCRRHGEFLRVEVWDTGPGIPEDQRENIFAEFHRLEQHDQQGEKCLGLGLAIAERIGRMLGHPIAVRSWVGRGTVFSITIPVSRSPALPAPVAAQPAAGGLNGLRVLCVDNEPSILEGMAALLAGWGCEVGLAADLGQARATLARGGADVVLADYHLDGEANGIDLLDTLRGELGYPIPGVLITANHGPALREAARERGYLFLNKPVKPAALRATLAGLNRPRTGTSG